jgi:hypothetical protein
MPIHDWTRVDAGIFHDFHHTWITQIRRALNRGLLPSEYYASAVSPPRGEFRLSTEADLYAARANTVQVRHTRDHNDLAALAIVSPGNKHNHHALRVFVDRARGMLRAGIHPLLIDLFPPGPADQRGLHKAIWDEITDNDFALPPDHRLTLAAYIGGPFPEALVQPVAVGLPLPDMPLFLTPEVYVPVPLEATYEKAWADVPSFGRDVLTAAPAPPP